MAGLMPAFHLFVVFGQTLALVTRVSDSALACQKGYVNALCRNPRRRPARQAEINAPAGRAWRYNQMAAARGATFVASRVGRSFNRNPPDHCVACDRRLARLVSARRSQTRRSADHRAWVDRCQVCAAISSGAGRFTARACFAAPGLAPCNTTRRIEPRSAVCCVHSGVYLG